MLAKILDYSQYGRNVFDSLSKVLVKETALPRCIATEMCNYCYHDVGVCCRRNAEGCTPFMQAVVQRAYPAALYLLDTAKRIATGRERIDVVDAELLVSMLFPPGSSADNSPLHVLCCNDMCSFTWTGDEHINQVTKAYDTSESFLRNSLAQEAYARKLAQVTLASAT